MKWWQRLFAKGKREARRKVTDALESTELKLAVKREVVKRLNDKINLPILKEKQEAVLIGLVYDIISGTVTKYVKDRI